MNGWKMRMRTKNEDDNIQKDENMNQESASDNVDAEPDDDVDDRTASSRIRGLQAVTRQLPRVKSAKTETWRQFEQNQGLLGKKSLGGKVKTLGPMNTVKGHPQPPKCICLVYSRV